MGWRHLITMARAQDATLDITVREQERYREETGVAAYIPASNGVDAFCFLISTQNAPLGQWAQDCTKNAPLGLPSQIEAPSQLTSYSPQRRGCGMANKKSGWVAAAGAIVVGAAVAISHSAGLAIDDVMRAVRGGAEEVHLLRPEPPPRIPPVPPREFDTLGSQFKPAVEQGVSTFQDLHKGNPTEQVVASAGCAVMSAGASDTQTQRDYETLIRQQLPAEYQTGFLSTVADRYIPRAANALFLADVNGGLGQSYVRYCVFRR